MSDDPITEKLRAAQHPLTRYLWIQADAITFTPHVLSKVYGDGRALFFFGTINSRPAYWIVRGCSTWAAQDYNAPDGAPDIGDLSDEILNDLEEEFGCAECGVHYEWDGDRILDLDQEAAEGATLTEADISYPIVNVGAGCHWGRLDWPDLEGIELEPHPFNRDYKLLK